MECMLQWLDDLDDLVSVIAMQAERLRRFCLALLRLVTTLLVAAGAALAAAMQPLPGIVLAAVLATSVLVLGSLRRHQPLLRR